MRSLHMAWGDRTTGRVGAEDQPFNAVSGNRLRRMTRFGSGATLAIARFMHQLGHRPATDAHPPGRPNRGLGSPELYIASRVTEYAAGSAAEGDRVWWYVPNVLRHGDKAPVVIYLHGFRAAIPDLYSEHIHHLTRQGIIVVFPRYNKASVRGMLTDNDQVAMFRRAVQSTRAAFAEMGPVADTNAVYAFGHSLGGMFAACWPAAGSVPVHGVVLCHPNISLERIPQWARGSITPLDFEPLIRRADVPVFLLNGDADTIAPTEESLRLFGLLENAPEKRLYVAKSDGHGSPRFLAGHLATVRDDSHMLHWLLESFGGGTASDDTLRYRFYYAALDAMIRGALPTFDMGLWSDGKPVMPIELIAVELRSGAGAPASAGDGAAP